ncbi:MAG: arsenic resistance N-acetyltransferase ArsN2 [Caldilinea sp.]
MTSITIRTADIEEWPAIAALLTGYDLPLDGAQEHVADFMVAVGENGDIEGVAAIERYQHVGLLRSVAVASQGNGVGAALVNHLIATARKQGLRQLVLLTTTAADYFPRFGFRRIERQDAPVAVHTSAEFQGACPASATVMLLEL